MNPISKLFYPLIRKGYLTPWTTLHAFFGGLIAWISQWFIPSEGTIYIVLTVAIGWEIWELFTEGWKLYGSVAKWLKKSISDVLVALLICLMVVWHG
ncbi:MAG: hypothetical protein H8E14_13510 [Candidatus Marinimicrobia bacterium]|nr:hypothetical protein [Candidatus Neomarinimicrobiota bacterium]